jgi:hypothetical protein
MWRASFVLLRDELLEREAFDTLLEAKVLIERWRQHYNTIRPHSALGYRPPALETLQPWGQVNFDNILRDYNTSYLDMFVDQGVIHIFCPHRWERVLHLTINDSDLNRFPTRKEFLKN